MSGTSLDGLSIGYFDVKQLEPFDSKFLKGKTYPFEQELREEIRRLAESESATIGSVARAHKKLGEHARDCLNDFFVGLTKPELVGYHGQTVFHDPGENHSTTTFQIGDPSPICVVFGIPVVSDFRSMDVAAGGQGAPIVSAVDYLKYRSESVGRAVLNVGGIANFTVLPKACKMDQVIAFDVGPGNILIDSLVYLLTKSRYDENGTMASRGKISKELFEFILRTDDYRMLDYPKTTGRERYGNALVEKILKFSQDLGLKGDDVVATVTEYTYFMINYHLGVLASQGIKVNEIIVGGGGTKNRTIMEKLKKNDLGARVVTHADFGIPPDFWECHAFAVLAYLSSYGYPGNVPSATGASRAVRLGRINFPQSATLG